MKKRFITLLTNAGCDDAAANRIYDHMADTPADAQKLASVIGELNAQSWPTTTAARGAG